MSTEPRQDEPATTGGASRFVLALLMAGLLGAATTVAVVLAEGGQARRSPTLSQQTLGAFTVGVPERWDRRDAQLTIGGRTLPLTRYHEDAGFRRELTIAEVFSDEPRPPQDLASVALRRLGVKLAPKQHVQFIGTRRIGPMVAATLQTRFATPDGDLRHRIFAILTLDGRRHLVIDVVASTYAMDLNAELMEQLAGAVADTRYAEVAQPWTLDGDVVDPVGGLIALRKASDDTGERLIFVPSVDARFMLLQAEPLGLSEPFDLFNTRIAGTSEQISVVPVDMLAALDPSLQTTPDARLLAAMHWRFWRATRMRPDPRYERGRLLDDGKHLHEMVLDPAARASTFRALFGVRVTESDGVLIEMVARRPPRRVARPDDNIIATVAGFARRIAAAVRPDAPADTTQSPPTPDAVDPPPLRADDKETTPGSPAPGSPGQ